MASEGRPAPRPLGGAPGSDALARDTHGTPAANGTALAAATGVAALPDADGAFEHEGRSVTGRRIDPRERPDMAAYARRIVRFVDGVIASDEVPAHPQAVPLVAPPARAVAVPAL